MNNFEKYSSFPALSHFLDFVKCFCRKIFMFVFMFEKLSKFLIEYSDKYPSNFSFYSLKYFIEYSDKYLSNFRNSS